MEFPFLNSLMLIVDKCTYIQFCMPGKILTFFGQSGFSGTVDNSATPVDSQPPRCSMGANASHRQNSYRNQKLDEDVWLLSPDQSCIMSQIWQIYLCKNIKKSWGKKFVGLQNR